MMFKDVSLAQNITLMLTYPNYTFLFSPTTFQVQSGNNVLTNFLDEQMCSEKQTFEELAMVIEIGSFVVLFLALISGKIIGL
jgi:hypothetical protein